MLTNKYVIVFLYIKDLCVNARAYCHQLLIKYMH